MLYAGVTEARGRPQQDQFAIEDHNIWGSCLPSSHNLKEHDYCKLRVDPESLKVDQLVVDEMVLLNRKIADLKKENNYLRSKCLILENIKLDDKRFQFWTGFPNYATFKALFDYLDCVALQKKKNWRGSEMKSKILTSEKNAQDPNLL
ncbi:hypothetical protein AWC38_SpisGene23269 [Stylophora pistillata]|uniref:Uncharacterized protein n=1 Tax=Stylophora pistillata TaxID=50429 RepID=A0A2B4R8M0_STYPI|nr:hypothetical protein AWC38_SpisGene23269 [Stylophora pistillata]